MSSCCPTGRGRGTGRMRASVSQEQGGKGAGGAPPPPTPLSGTVLASDEGEPVLAASGAGLGRSVVWTAELDERFAPLWTRMGIGRAACRGRGEISGVAV